MLGNPDLCLSEKDLEFYTLAEIDIILRGIGRKLKNFAQLPTPPPQYMNSAMNFLILEETQYDVAEMSKLHDDLISKCNNDQREIYDSVVDVVKSKKGGLFFVYGSGGCGKTFLWNTIIARLRKDFNIVLPVGSSGIAVTLLPGGRTVHSHFKIPILLDDLFSCNISNNSDIAELIRRTDLIIWGEAPIKHGFAFEAFDCTLRDIMRSTRPECYSLPFGGIPVLLGGDSRQILPVIKHGTRSDIVSYYITRSRLWDSCKLFKLSKNIRLCEGKSVEEANAIRSFGQWVLDIGDGTAQPTLFANSEEDKMKIYLSLDKCINSRASSINNLIDCTYPDLANRCTDKEYLTDRAILTPTNQTIYHINGLILEKIPWEVFNYYSADKAEESGGYTAEIDLSFPTEYLNSLSIPGLPAHELKVKIGAVVMLMRNLNQILGLCNDTRLIVRKCFKHAIECEVLSGNSVGTGHFIPRMELLPTDSILPFHSVRRQFPLQLCYAMTINKAHGQSLRSVGLYLPKSVLLIVNSMLH